MLQGVVLPERFEFDTATRVSLLRNGMSGYESGCLVSSFYHAHLRLRVEDAHVLLLEARRIGDTQHDYLLSLLATLPTLQPEPGPDAEANQIVESILPAITMNKKRTSAASWPEEDDA